MKPNKHSVRFLTFEMYHGKNGVGSTRLRVHNVIKNWPKAALYKYGENPDVMIFQKVYIQQDWRFQEEFKGIKILDICDPDWLNHEHIKETIDCMDAVTCPTEPLAEFLRQLTDKPVVVIPDRFDMTDVPPMRLQTGEVKRVLWFGYKQNAELMRFVIPSLERLGLDLLVISNEDPMMWRWAEDPDEYQKKCYYTKYDEETFFKDTQVCQLAVLPDGSRPQDRFKSNNRTIKAMLASLPPVKTGDELRELLDLDKRNQTIKDNYVQAKEEYNVVKSVEQLKTLIEEIDGTRRR